MVTFAKAVKHEAKLRLAIAGPSGSGKTYTGLAIATHLVPGGRIALVDTEHGSASKYADTFGFDVLELEAPFHPDRFCEAIEAAAGAGYDVLVLDSLTHAWSGPGGLLEIVDGIAARMRSKNTFAAWKDATPIQNHLVETILAANVHIIATIRSKQDYVQEKDDKGATVITKVGMAPQQREGFEYEFDVFAEMDIQNRMLITKTRCPALNGKTIGRPGKEVATVLGQWLKGQPGKPPAGAAPLTGQAPAETPPPPPKAPAATSAESGIEGSATTVAGPKAATAGHASQAEATRRQAAEQAATTAGKPPRPWSTAKVLQTMGQAVEWAKAHPTEIVVNGKYGATLGCLDHILEPYDHHELIEKAFGVRSATDLTAEQKWALVKWADPRKDAEKSPWYLPDYVVEEFKCIVTDTPF